MRSTRRQPRTIRSTLLAVRPGDREQPLFGLRRSDAGQRADFRIRQLAAGERARPAGAACRAASATQRARGRRGIEAERHVSHAAHERKPLASRARVEFSDEIEECAVAASRCAARSRSSSPSDPTPRRSSGGLGNRSDSDIRRGVHRRVSFHLCADSTPRIFEALRATRMCDRRGCPEVSRCTALGHLETSTCRWAGIRRRLCQARCARV